jgi:ribosomal protein S6
VGNENTPPKDETQWSSAEFWRVGGTILLVLITSNRLCSYWTLHFDASPRTVRSLNRIMRRDPRVIRWTVLKLADNLEALAKKGQKMQLPDKMRTPVSYIVD